MLKRFLSREELKAVVGGSRSCGVYLPLGWASTGSCSFTTRDVSHSDIIDDVIRGVFMDEVFSIIQNVDGSRIRYCCDSCGNASWY